MSTFPPTRATAYQEYVFSNVASTVRAGQGIYNYSELAEMVGLKPTHNFRKRVKQMVAEGRLEAIAAFTPRGGIEARFMATAKPETGDIPF